MAEPFPDDCWYLTGATASGKTSLGLQLADRLNAEIVSLDSMAIYRRLDIGTAKPTADERRRIRHHLVDLIEPQETFSLAQYLATARLAVDDILDRGRVPLFVGGTPLYLKALLRGLFEGPPADWAFRRQLETQVQVESPSWLHAQLAAVDPTSASRLHPRDTRRLIRALEVYHLTGRPISQWQQQFDRVRPAEQSRVFVLNWPREVLYARIDARVDAMFDAGLVDEVRNLLSTGVEFSRTARQALGYREVLDHLAEKSDLSATVDLVKTRTRQFAKRQLTWFRSLPECHWLDATQGADRLLAEMLRKR